MQADPAEHPMVERARALQPQVAARATETEANGSPPRDLIETITDAGLYRMFIPAAAGGEEVPPLVVFHAIEALAVADPSTAWVVMLASELSLVTGFLTTEHLREMIGADQPGGPRCRIAGSSRPTNTGTRVDGGWLVNGISTFASGIDHATHVVVAFKDEAQPGDQYMSFVDPGQGEILRTWDTMGLRGTGSHDYRNENVFASDSRTMKFGSRPIAQGPNWRIPDGGIASWLQNGGQAIGAAQGAIDEVVRFAKHVDSKSDSRSLADREHFRVAVGRAQARVGSARSYVREMGFARLGIGRWRRTRPRCRLTVATGQRQCRPRGHRSGGDALPSRRHERDPPTLDARAAIPRSPSRASAQRRARFQLGCWLSTDARYAATHPRRSDS